MSRRGRQSCPAGPWHHRRSARGNSRGLPVDSRGGCCGGERGREEDIIELEIGSAEFLWAIPNEADTNLASSNCTYDRMVLTGDIIDNFNGTWGVDNTFSEKSISDHWPVWIELVIRID